MGKKSKKGQTRAGQKQRPKAGAGKARTRTRSMDGSVNSNDAVPATTATNAAKVPVAETVPANMKVPVNQTTAATAAGAAVSAAVTANKENGVSTQAAGTTHLDMPPPVQDTESIPDDVVDKVIVKAAEDALKKAQDSEKEKQEAEKRKKIEAAVAAARAAEEKKAEPVVVEEKKAEPVVEEKAEPVVEEKAEPVIEKKASVETKPKAASAPAVPKAEPKPTVIPETNSRGLALDQPAPEEAAAKQKDCECIIL